jgi:NADH-quinone oxidoreductase subunit E
MKSLRLDSILKGRLSQPHQLIEVLQDVQECCGYIPEEAMRYISKNLGVPLMEVYRVASFYKAFSLKPQGRHPVAVCMGTACHVRGSPNLLEKVTETLKINPGETSSDRRFSLATVNCLGCCAIGPVVTVDNQYHSNPTPEKLDKLFASCD